MNRRQFVYGTGGGFTAAVLALSTRAVARIGGWLGLPRSQLVVLAGRHMQRLKPRIVK